MQNAVSSIRPSNRPVKRPISGRATGSGGGAASGDCVQFVVSVQTPVTQVRQWSAGAATASGQVRLASQAKRAMQCSALHCAQSHAQIGEMTACAVCKTINNSNSMSQQLSHCTLVARVAKNNLARFTSNTPPTCCVGKLNRA